MKKKLLTTLLIIGVTAAIAIGGTIAIFTDQEETPNKNFTIGTVDVVVTGDIEETFTNIAPGYSDTFSFTVTNPDTETALSIFVDIEPQMVGELWGVGGLRLSLDDSQMYLSLDPGQSQVINYTVSFNNHENNNDYMGKTGSINFKVNAVQQDYNTPYQVTLDQETFDTNVDSWSDSYGYRTWNSDGTMLVKNNTGENYSTYTFLRPYYTDDDWTGHFYSEIDFYLDPNDFTLGEGFDYTQAMANTQGTHLRDYIIHFTKDTSTGKLLVGASNNTNNNPREDLDTLANHAEITTAGWYTVQHHFYEGTNGYLECEIKLIAEDGTVIFSEIRGNENDKDLMSNVGGAYYSWFCGFVKETGIKVDNHKMYLYLQ